MAVARTIISLVLFLADAAPRSESLAMTSSHVLGISYKADLALLAESKAMTLWFANFNIAWAFKQ